MNLRTEHYMEQQRRWPKAGRHILAQFDADTIVVYQAYRPAIGHYAVQHQRFGGEFSFNRTSWIKPNFLWMMYRCGWGAKEGQEVTLAVHLLRKGFEHILREAVHSSFQPAYGSPECWRARLSESDVRLQWDPDHDPQGRKQERRAIQLGLSGGVLRQYARDWIVRIEDISEFVRQQHAFVFADGFSELLTPSEEIFPITDAAVASRIGIDPHPIETKL